VLGLQRLRLKLTFENFVVSPPDLPCSIAAIALIAYWNFCSMDLSVHRLA
jgi:hypothetical protein